jgi:RNA polymerase sigma factor (sigma-70 family)
MAIETLGAALRQIGRLFAGGVISSLSDRQLLDLFIEGRDADAFEVLVARHGPMVLSVCRGILRDPADAEDAFQATFLVLVKKARTIRGHHALGGWLHRVARRVAVEANRAGARRRAGEREVAAMASPTVASGASPIDRLLSALHEEIDRLPEEHRLAIVLCELEGLTQAQAAVALNWSERTLRRRLAEARDRLKARLGRRGLEPADGLLGAVFLREARAPVPPPWREATVRAALEILDPAVTAGTVSAAAQSLTQEVLKTMLIRKLTIASAALIGAGVMAWAASAALIPRGEEPPKAAPAAVAQAPAPVPRPEGETDPLDETGIFPVQGRVFDPDGKPVAGAAIYVWHYTEHGWDPSDPITHGQRGRVAVSDADGRFHFKLDKASSDWPYSDGPTWHGALIAAVAPGFGPAWIKAGSLLKGGEASLRLVPDDVPIRGRVVDSQGRPVSGVTVRADQIAAADAGTDLDTLLAAGEFRYEKASSQYLNPNWLGRRGTWTTDADGRFEIRGVGRDRMIGLKLEGPGLAHVNLYAMARPSHTTPKPRPRPSGKRPDMMFFGSPPPPVLYGATFEQIIGPTKPIVGVVRAKGTGQPAAGVKVTGIEPTTWTWVSAMTDKEGRFQLLGLPKAGVFQVRVDPRTGSDPFLTAVTTVTDTEGLKPIEAGIEVPRGVIITGRLIDGATGRLVRAKHVTYVKLPTNPNEGYPETGHSGAVDATFKMTVPPGEGFLYANVRGRETPYVRARLRKEDKGKGVGGPGDGETSTVLLNAYNAYMIIDVPADGKDFIVDLELTRGLSRKGRLVDPEGKPVTGARCYGLSSTWGFVKTLPDETFEVHGLEPGHPRQVIFAHKERRLVGAVTLKDEDLKSEATLEVRLGPPGCVKGRLVDEDGLPLAGATLSVMSYELNGLDNLPGGQDALWPDGETFTVDSEGRFEVVGLKPGVKTFVGVQAKTRPNTRLDTGKVFRNIVLERTGEVRDLGDVKVKVVPNFQ